MTNKTSKYKYGDKVRVAAGVTDPDFKTNIESWSGEIDDIEIIDDQSWMYHIIWDKGTLQFAGGDYISKCEKENLDYESMYLLENELELIENNGDHNINGVFVA
ncbi:MAG: hypothetical protein V3V22_02165 [Methylococcales bacterium]